MFDSMMFYFSSILFGICVAVVFYFVARKHIMINMVEEEVDKKIKEISGEYKEAYQSFCKVMEAYEEKLQEVNMEKKSIIKRLVPETVYEEISKIERRRIWEKVNDAIKKGHLEGNGCDDQAQRNGMVLAANIIKSDGF